MVNPSTLPNVSTQVLDSRGAMAQAWRDFFLQLANQAGSDALRAELEALAARVTVLEDGTTGFTISGAQSVRVLGTPSSGIVQLLLQGDVYAPGESFYYGTNAAGTKGFHAIPDSAVPYAIAAGETYTVAANKQALFAMPIDNEGTLVVDGYLIGVD